MIGEAAAVLLESVRLFIYRYSLQLRARILTCVDMSRNF
jgi:hypothetical protein